MYPFKGVGKKEFYLTCGDCWQDEECTLDTTADLAVQAVSLPTAILPLLIVVYECDGKLLTTLFYLISFRNLQQDTVLDLRNGDQVAK